MLTSFDQRGHVQCGCAMCQPPSPPKIRVSANWGSSYASTCAGRMRNVAEVNGFHGLRCCCSTLARGEHGVHGVQAWRRKTRDDVVALLEKMMRTASRMEEELVNLTTALDGDGCSWKKLVVRWREELASDLVMVTACAPTRMMMVVLRQRR
ncbi:hypothetical protein LR48_Vigan09g057500 [Vigna angularis]|uniref:Uncharacterized protein n=1 Tax=Phaseolus angularis TaxID=3914 RepID=A0A0L9VA05_PHAAN|nr:hypothetical protein LR48_Vigan09g057500 [Vigna angularis]